MLRNITIGDKITLLRVEKKMGLCQLAFKSDVAPGTLKSVESGYTKSTRVITLCKIVDVLGITIGEFMDGFDIDSGLFPEYESDLEVPA